MDKIEQFKKYLLEAGIVLFSAASLVNPSNVGVVVLAGVFISAYIAKKFIDRDKLDEKLEIYKKFEEFQLLVDKKVVAYNEFNNKKFNEYQIILNNLSAKENFRGAINEQKEQKARRF